MKKVRFVTPTAELSMSDSDCHSPRPFMERQTKTISAEPCYQAPKVLPYSNDPIQRFECSNSSPYPTVSKTRPSMPEKDFNWKPSEDLDLSFLDSSIHEPRQPAFSKSALINKVQKNIGTDLEVSKPKVLSSIENNTAPPNVLVKESSFFIRRDNLDKYHFSINPLLNQFKHFNLGKENDPLGKKAEIMKTGFQQRSDNNILYCNEPVVSPILKMKKGPIKPQMYMKHAMEDYCQCHHCVKSPGCTTAPMVHKETYGQNQPFLYKQHRHHISAQSNSVNCQCNHQTKACAHCHSTPLLQQYISRSCNCRDGLSEPLNTVEKKTWAIEKFEQKKQECTDVEKQANVSEEKREPTVADLFRIIKLQNEQLQLLQEKVDNFISASKQNTPTVSCSTEHVSVSENEQVKMSIGVMTSFEMVRTSTIINKEVLKQTTENAQIQCNRSQISIKEVISKPLNQNFLDGIMPVNNPSENQNQRTAETANDKTLNELSLYNVQVDNATTPNLSPEQTLYLDVRDYSDSDASSNDQSNVGWTYYNKVMTHVNGMLQDSDMPSSASAMFRNMRQQCMHMQIDKPSISVTKRVKFGDDPLGIHQPHIYASTDTSLKMNQLAAKYLNAPVRPPQTYAIKQRPTPPIDMSFATRNYMEKHNLIQSAPSSSKSPQAGEIPRFLDITALKQQPKFL